MEREDVRLITDRTEEDALLRTAKGIYNATDLVRVESAVAELVRLAAGRGLRPNVQVKTDWGLPGAFSQDSWPTKSQMTRYLANVRTVCAALDIDTAGLPQSMEQLTWQGANRIEEALQRALHRVRALLAIYRYSGEFYAGEENSL